MTVRSFKEALRTTDEIDLTVTGRRTGRQITLPVWFDQEDDKLYLVPVKGTESHWYKNVRKTPTVRLRADDATLTTRATPLTDQGRIQAVVQRFRDKYGDDQVRSYYSKLDAAVEIPLS
ncbi:nitroreductase/quinone reductase family protein [Thermasporomyces composti]|uniref:Deazaflavin-dependent oxidoreductase (Nitroreductase family) n=1 Tax=Thermasporomyces composti TaxID=696763 RepID=A0A3D9VKH0_THECX|nr:nitroreductase/quinone reductase family protein [Thermasporomyces composti]REF37861.1 deazaflavin-dependent oxidoreductase (nitroreductase family) [Thermasporomyces composti]